MPDLAACARCEHPRLDHAPVTLNGGRGACRLEGCPCPGYRSVLADVTGLPAS